MALDPGHGGDGNPGTVGVNGLTEVEVSLDIAQRLRELLTGHGYTVVMTRTADVRVPLPERTRLANAARADIFVSIHVNWLNGAQRGIETFIAGATEDPRRLDLLDHEDGGAVRPVAVGGELPPIDLADPRRRASLRLAGAVHRELGWYLGQVEPGMGDRGIKMAPFSVLLATEMPAILVEVSTLSHPEDARLLELPAYRDYIALALYNGIRVWAEVDPPAAAVEARARR